MGEHDRLDAVTEVELLQDVRDVRLDRRVADVELRPISALERPRAIRRSTSSRARSARRAPVGGAGCGIRVNCLITRFVIAGERSASPGATVRIAASSCSGGSSLSTNPLAPARSASYTYSSRSNVVRIRIRAVSSAARIRRVASSPSSSGMRMSISTTVGWKRAALLDGLDPVARFGDDFDVGLARRAACGSLRGPSIGRRRRGRGCSSLARSTGGVR